MKLEPLNIIFILGILIVVFCILSFVLPYGQNFKERTQKIQGFGLNLEVSVITLFIIIGFVLIFFGGGIWWQLNNINQQLEELRDGKTKAEGRIKELQERLEKTASLETVAFLKLPDEASPPDVSDVDCDFETASGNEGKADVSTAPASGSFKIAIRNINKDTVITALTLKTKDKKRKWKIEKTIMPFQPPTYEIKPY